MHEWINSAGGTAASISAIFALLTLILYKPLIRPWLDRRRKEREETAQFRKDVMDKLDGVIDDIADLQYERLSQAHDFYVTRGWCPTSKKHQLCLMYQSYTAKGRNHLSEYYEQEILGLKDKPD